jgi:hypothetical protein
VAESPYSPRLRTAVVLCGAGTAGAYQAGVLKAFSEAGVKVDLLAAHGIGVATALCGAIDGGARLWDPAGPWAGPGVKSAYRWRGPLRVAAIGLAAAGILIVSPLAVILVATLTYLLSLLAGLAGLSNVAVWFVDLYQRTLAVLFNPPFIPTVVPRGLVLAGLVVLGVLAVAAFRAFRHDRTRRRWRGAFWWQLLGSPLDAGEPEKSLVDVLWSLVRGAATAPQPASADIGRRYVELLCENFGQPGFREVVVAVHDLDARRDIVGAVLPPELRAAFGARRREAGAREAEMLDLSGPARDLLVDLLKGAVRLPVAAAPHVCEFSAESYWRGELHRLCDRPELVPRLIDEIAALGVEQVILVSPAAPAATPHGIRAVPIDLRARVGELLRSIETAALQDGSTLALTRFSGVFLVRPDHNPIGPFDFAGAYDPASDRTRTPAELMKQGYHDAYVQFIEPIVAAGEKIEAI